MPHDMSDYIFRGTIYWAAFGIYCLNVEEECALDLKGQVDFFNLGSGNLINSIAVLPDCALTIYDDVSFRGRAKVLRGGAQDEDQVGWLPNLISEI